MVYDLTAIDSRKGIFTVTQLSHTFRPRRRPKKLRDKREKYHHSLKALAIREKKLHIVGSPELIGPDGVHPTDAGHAYMANKIAPLIGAQLPKRV